MRTMMILAVCLVTMMTRAAEVSDTVVVTDANRVTVVNNDSVLKISINGTKRQPDFHYDATLQTNGSDYSSTIGRDFDFSFGRPRKHSNDGQEERYTSEAHAYIGFNTATGNRDVVKNNTWQSVEMGFWVDFGIRPWRNGHRFSYGVGLDWSNWRLTNHTRFVKADNGTVSVEPVPEGADPKRSRIKEMGFIFPLMYSYTSHGWGFSLGPVVHVNTHANILTRYTIDGKEQKLKASDIHHNKVTVDLMATFINPLVDIYVKYNPCNILDTSYGPRFHSLSFGLLF